MKALTQFGVLALMVLAVGCSRPAPQQQASEAPAASSDFLLAARPADVQGVALVRSGDGKDGDTVVVEGRIGGSEKPFVDGLAAFTIVDMAIPHCSADEGCPTPWDYCCETGKLKDNQALVKFVGADGQPVSEDARKLLNVKELSHVVVQGKLRKDEQGNVTVLAEKAHVVAN